MRNERLPFLEGRCSRGTSVCYRPHTHPTLSLGLVDEGSAKVKFAGHTFTLRTGHVVVIGPGVVHSCNPPTGQRWSYRMFYFDWAWVQRVAPALARAFAPECGHFPLNGAAARAAGEVIASALTAPKSGAEATVARALQRILQRVKPAPVVAAKPGSNRATIVAAREFLARHCDRRVSLQTLAKELGQDRYQFIRRFRSQLGLTPQAYKLDQQVIEARRQLARGAPIAEVAHALGFADQSHFQRVFKSHAAATPAQYQRGGKRLTRRAREKAA